MSPISPTTKLPYPRVLQAENYLEGDTFKITPTTNNFCFYPLFKLILHHVK